MNVADTLAALLETDAELAALNARRDNLRSRLEQEAIARYADDGAAPTWRHPLGTCGLAGADAVALDVTDGEALASYLTAGKAPTEVTWRVTVEVPGSIAGAEHVARTLAASLEASTIEPADDGAPDALALTTVTVTADVRTSYLNLLLKHAANQPARTAGDVVAVIHDGGEVIPGVQQRRKAPYLSVRLDPTLKAARIAEALAAAGGQ